MSAYAQESQEGEIEHQEAQFPMMGMNPMMSMQGGVQGYQTNYSEDK